MKEPLRHLWVLLSPTPPPPLVEVLAHICKSVITRSTPFQPRGLISELWHLLFKAAARPAVSIQTSLDPQEAYTYVHTRLWLTEFTNQRQGFFLKVKAWTVAFRSPCHTLAAWQSKEGMVSRITQTLVPLTSWVVFCKSFALWALIFLCSAAKWYIPHGAVLRTKGENTCTKHIMTSKCQCHPLLSPPYPRKKCCAKSLPV